ncbi:MAG: AraC family transcriptional regulator [Bacteroidota bacterium]
MKAAVLEKIIPDIGSSMRVLDVEMMGPKCINYWHYHPEIELVFLDHGSATRHIGNHISRYEDGDLILVGSEVPHRSFTEDLMGGFREVVVQWRPDFMGATFFDRPEMRKVKELLQRSKQGLSFYGSTKKEIGDIMQAMHRQSGFERVHSLLGILHRLSLSEECELLGAGDCQLIYRPNDQQRIEAIFGYVKNNYSETIDLEAVARLVSMTRQSFCRYFKQCTGRTFFEFVNQYRITETTRQLISTDLSISEVSYQCGFNNLSTFNKQFKKKTGMTPAQYRRMYSRVVVR